MNVLFLVNGRFFKTLCKTVLNAESFSVSFSTEKHTIVANISDKCYFKSIDNKNLDSLKTDFYFKRNYKNIKEFTAKLEDCFSSFINNSITDRHFHGNIDECISKILDEIKEAKTETTETEATETETKRKRKPITTDIDMIKDFTKETETVESVTTHKYEIKVFKDGAFSHSNTFSLESFAEYAFAIMELKAIDFPDPCFKVIQLFKDGKPMKRSVINFGVKVNNQTGEKWQIINENTLDSIMKIFKSVQGKCREKIVVDGEHLNDILFDIFKHLLNKGLLADKKPKKIHYDFRHMYPNNCISLPESTHFTIMYNRGFFYIDLNSIKRGFCPNRKTMNFFVEGEKNG